MLKFNINDEKTINEMNEVTQKMKILKKIQDAVERKTGLEFDADETTTLQKLIETMSELIFKI